MWLGLVVEDLAAGFADVEGCGYDGGDGAGEGAGGEADEEGGGVVFVLELGVFGRGGGGGWGVNGCKSVADGFVAPPVYAAEGDVAPHCKGEAAPKRGVALRMDHFLETG